MPRPARHLVRFVVIVALLGALPLLTGPTNPKNGPYLSALADPPAGSALAATHCPDRSCAGFGGPCMKEVGYHCFKGPGQCFTRGCQTAGLPERRPVRGPTLYNGRFRCLLTR